MNVELLARLTVAPGVPSREDAVRAIVVEELEPIAELCADAMGNLIALRKGAQPDGQRKKLMIAAHMDEIGFIVRYIDDKGFLRLQPLGGFDPRQLVAQRVIVHAQSGPLKGTFNLGTKPKHLLSPEEANKAPSLDDLFVDVGLDGEKAKSTIRLGDMVTLDRGFQTAGDLYVSKSMDDRVCVFIMIEALKKATNHQVDVYAVATVQEEVGLRGAAAAGSSIKPDIAVGLDITLANDYPGIPETHQVTKLGAGAAIKVMDASLICNIKVVDHMVKVAEKHGIKHQMEILPLGGTDPGAIQRLHGGIPSITLSVPTRYVHTVNETVHKDDVQASIDLLAKYIEEAHEGDYSYPVR